jgi:hypothetical protein
MRKVTIGQVADAIVHVDFFYEEGEGGAFQPTVRNIAIEDVTCRKSNYALYLRGFAASPIRDVRLARCTFENVAKTSIATNVQNMKFESVSINGSPAKL